LREVVGIARNSVVNAIGEVPPPLVYLPVTQDYAPAATLQVQTTGRPEAVIAGVRGQIQSLDPNLAITNVQTIGEIIDQGLWAPEMGAALLALFGGLALVLAAVGVYGVLAYSVTQQTREIGIRMAMGAERSHVLRLIVGQGLKLAGAGLAVGVLVSLALTRQLSSLLFGVSAYDPLTYAGVILILVFVALLACYIPAQRATGVDPLVALRYE
jgi:putative ABC transport system permease protein